MKRFLLALLLVLTCSACSYAQQGVLPYAIDSTGTPKPNSINKPLFVTPVGESGGTATIDITLPAIALATQSTMTIATGVLTLLKNVASFSDGDLFVFQGNGAYYWQAFSGTAPASATVQARGFLGASGEAPNYIRLKTSMDIGFIGAAAGTPTTVNFSFMREQ